MRRVAGLFAFALLVPLTLGCAENVASTSSNANAAVEANKASIMRFMDEVASQGKMEVIDQLVAADFVDHETSPGMPEGIEGVKAWFGMVRTAFPDLKVTIEHSIGEGDIVMAHSRWIGTHQGEFMGVKPTGKRVEFEAMDVVRFDNGMAVEHWGVTDMMTLMEQIGAIPAPPTSS